LSEYWAVKTTSPLLLCTVGAAQGGKVLGFESSIHKCSKRLRLSKLPNSPRTRQLGRLIPSPDQSSTMLVFSDDEICISTNSCVIHRLHALAGLFCFSRHVHEMHAYPPPVAFQPLPSTLAFSWLNGVFSRLVLWLWAPLLRPMENYSSPLWESNILRSFHLDNAFSTSAAPASDFVTRELDPQWFPRVSG
jgi:hypothetical protein